MSTDGQYWTHTWTPIIGCSPVSSGCAHCWAARMATRHAGNPKTPQYHGLAKGGKWTGETRLLPEVLAQPLRWRKPRIVLANAMGDLFHEHTPDEHIAAVFGVMAACPESTFIVPTKRTERAREWFMWVLKRSTCQEGKTWPGSIACDCQEQTVNATGGFFSNVFSVGHLVDDESAPWPLANVWLLASVEDQATADERIPDLLACPAAVLGVSYEPALGPVDFGGLLDGLDWVICGGESGPGARPMHRDWARSVRDQCFQLAVPLWFKQWGEWAPEGPASAPQCAVDRSGRVAKTLARDDFPRGATGADRWQCMYHVGKQAAGRLLDGRTWDERPEVTR